MLGTIFEWAARISWYGKKFDTETLMFPAQKQILQTIYIKICGEIWEENV